MASRVLTQTNNDVLRQIVNIFALGAVLTVNVLSNALPINGRTAGEISDAYPSLVTPAGYVFSIWGLIYTLLIVFVVYQALPAQKDNPRLERLGYMFALSCACNFFWIFAWHYGVVWLSELLMLGLLASLIVCYNRLGIGKTEVSAAEKWAVRLAFSVYLGWITVATIANTTVLLLEWGVEGGWLAPVWAVIVIGVAAAIGLLVLRRRGDVPYSLVLVWAFFGIAVSQWGAEAFVVITALVAAGVLAVLAYRRIREPKSVAV